MASVTKNDIPGTSMFMACFWTMVKKFWVPEDSDAYWEAVCAYAEALYKKFPSDFCKRQIMAYLDYLEEKYKSGRTKK